ncbi:MAG: hypothetical protein ACREMQ_00165 [Longimicrobiales bacterium]
MAARHAPRLPHYDDRAYLQELIRHVDPARRTLGRFFHDEIAGPLGLEFYIGLPPEIPGERLAVLKTLSRRRAVKSTAHDASPHPHEDGHARFAAPPYDAPDEPGLE